MSRYHSEYLRPSSPGDGSAAGADSPVLLADSHSPVLTRLPLIVAAAAAGLHDEVASIMKHSREDILNARSVVSAPECHEVTRGCRHLM